MLKTRANLVKGEKTAETQFRVSNPQDSLPRKV
jgi:hypothetical protein